MIMRVIRPIILSFIMVIIHPVESFFSSSSQCRTLSIFHTTRCHSSSSSYHMRLRSGKRKGLQLLMKSESNNDDTDDNPSRRDVISIGLASSITGVVTALGPSKAVAESMEPRAAIRPFAYRVDSTIPPTLLPLSANQERSVMSGLGKGLGTEKTAVFADKVTLNNIAQKSVFGTIDAVRTVLGIKEVEELNSGVGFASFVAMGVPKRAVDDDILLGKNLLELIMRGRSKETPMGLGLYFAPLSTQSALKTFLAGGNLLTLCDELAKAGVSMETIDLYKPILNYSKSNNLDLLAMSPEVEDVMTVRLDGLQNVNSDRRSTYVMDSEGFVQQTADPKYRLYSDRSLLKDFEPLNEDDQPGNFFAERILVHETGATALARYTCDKPDALVAFFAPMADVRFMGGTSGRLPRICKYLNPVMNKVSENFVTTVLLNPSAEETLSLSRYLRLEIGTSPKDIQYQTKVADYLWFNKMPKVNMIPRLMNG